MSAVPVCLLPHDLAADCDRCWWCRCSTTRTSQTACHSASASTSTPACCAFRLPAGAAETWPFLLYVTLGLHSWPFLLYTALGHHSCQQHYASHCPKHTAYLPKQRDMGILAECCHDAVAGCISGCTTTTSTCRRMRACRCRPGGRSRAMPPCAPATARPTASAPPPLPANASKVRARSTLGRDNTVLAFPGYQACSADSCAPCVQLRRAAGTRKSQYHRNIIHQASNSRYCNHIQQALQALWGRGARAAWRR
jgi:hypothetical protein